VLKQKLKVHTYVLEAMLTFLGIKIMMTMTIHLMP